MVANTTWWLDDLVPSTTLLCQQDFVPGLLWCLHCSVPSVLPSAVPSLRGHNYTGHNCIGHTYRATAGVVCEQRGVDDLRESRKLFFFKKKNYRHMPTAVADGPAVDRGASEGNASPGGRASRFDLTPAPKRSLKKIKF